MKSLCFAAALLLGVCGCGGPVEQSTETSGEDFDSLLLNPREEEPIIRQLQSATGKTWEANITPLPDIRQAKVTVTLHGLVPETSPVDFGETDPVIAMYQSDLDGDGFEELYLITQSGDTDSFGTVLGLASLHDETIMVISFEGATPYNTKESEPYDGYAGHDAFSMRDGKLINEFPVYLPDGKPSGRTRRITYELVKGDGSLLLTPAKDK
ncbi:MAG: hypothetical protein JNK10_07350 [Cyclobacteriaceae bacterium]|nr:hypothetical protein [Cyclobacteriaceae bacterium]